MVIPYVLTGKRVSLGRSTSQTLCEKPFKLGNENTTTIF